MKGHDLSGTVTGYRNFWSRSPVTDEQRILAGRLTFLSIFRRLVGPGDVDTSLTRRKRA